MASLSPRVHPDASLTFEELYNENFARVNRYLRYRVNNTWDADDLTALVFMKALEKFNTYRGQSSFTAWLFSIAHNAYVDYVRSTCESAAAESRLRNQAAPGGSPEEQILLSEEVRELRRLLNKLPPDYRDVMALRYVGELRFTQIAEVLGKTGAAVRMIHYRGLKILRNRMNQAGSG